MAAPMGGASPLNTKKIKDREDAIRRRLKLDDLKANLGNDKTNFPKGKTAIKPGGITPKHKIQHYIKGAREGFSKSDYGALAGAAIPYQIGKETILPGRSADKPSIMRRAVKKPTMPTVPPKKPRTANKPQNMPKIGG